MPDDHPASSDPSLPRITLPDFTPPTLEEIERQRALVAKVRTLRDEFGLIRIPADELIRQVRSEADGLDD